MASSNEKSGAIEAKNPPRIGTRSVVLAISCYLAAVVLCGAVTSAGALSAGFVIYVSISLLLLAHSSLIHRNEPCFSRFLMALALAPLAGAMGISLLTGRFTVIQRIALTSIPLIVASILVIVLLKLKPEDIGLSPLPLRKMTRQGVIALVGIPLGVLEFGLLRPTPWIADGSALNVAFAIIVIVSSTGFAEELMFRGVIQKCAQDLLGNAGILCVALTYCALQVTFLPWLDLMFIFFVALLFGEIVRRTNSLTGVIGAHSLLNMVLYLALPRYV